MSELTLAEASEQAIAKLSQARKEPDWLRTFRAKSLKLFRELPAELSNLYTKYADLTGVDFESTSLDLPEPSSEEIDNVVGKFKSDRAITIYQLESKTLQPEIPDALLKEGVVFTEIGTAISRDPEYFRRYFLEKAILSEEDKFAALNNAFFNSGFFLHVPKGLEITTPFRMVTVLSSEGSSLFAEFDHGRTEKQIHSTRGTLFDKAYSAVEEIHLQRSI